MTLPYDIARCNGRFDPAPNQYWRAINQECTDCQRRTAPRSEYQWMMQAPEFEDTCAEKIAESHDQHQTNP